MRQGLSREYVSANGASGKSPPVQRRSREMMAEGKPSQHGEDLSVRSKAMSVEAPVLTGVQSASRPEAGWVTAGVAALRGSVGTSGLEEKLPRGGLVACSLGPNGVDDEQRTLGVGCLVGHRDDMAELSGSGPGGDGWELVLSRRVGRANGQRADVSGSRGGEDSERADMRDLTVSPGEESLSPPHLAETPEETPHDRNRYLQLHVEEPRGSVECKQRRIEVTPATGAICVVGAPWRRRRAKRLGKIEAHVRFLQFVFRRTRRVRPGCWARGGMCRLWFFRPLTMFACMGGRALAPEGAFIKQQRRSAEVLDWYRQYVDLLRRLRSGRTPTAIIGFSGQGGVFEGVRRGGGAAHAQDIRAQPKHDARYGKETFSLGDSRSPAELRRLKRATGAFVTLGSPPCKSHSTAWVRGKASEEPMIRETRSAYREVGGLYAIENVVGAGSVMENPVSIRGSYFGLHVDRCRLWEANFELHVDRALKEGGDRLRCGTCTGFRRRWRRLDPFGRPEQRDCCTGNLWAVQGDKPLRCTPGECADAMGLDRDHMDYDGMAQAVPPVYGQWVFAQACMREVEREYGLRAITFDEVERNPREARGLMAHWLRGAGDASAERGTGFQAPETATRVAGGGEAAVEPVGVARGVEGEPQYRPVHTDRTGDLVAPASEATVREAELREVCYSWAGGFDQVAGGAEVTSAVGPIQAIDELRGRWREGVLRGKNTLLCLNHAEVGRRLRAIVDEVEAHPGTRVTMEASGWQCEAALAQVGFKMVRRTRRGAVAYASEARGAVAVRACSFWALGEVYLAPGGEVDYAVAEGGMDPLDRTGAPAEPKSAKAARSYAPIPWEKERWDVGLPAELDLIMARRGVGIYPVEELGPSEIPFYRWVNSEGLLKSIQEADRGLAAGAMEYVPESRVAEVEAVSTIHPWTIVDQGGGKWRLCHDYSVGINRVVPTVPFSLPSVWDAAGCVQPSSCFAKYDIRDGFWHMPVGEDSKKRLVVRHPGTGRLMWASRLPFGYLESPRLFCGLTEAIVERLRRKAAGRGIHFFVFVDDVLCVGDTEALTREGCRLIEEEFEALGVQWAPHKKRGPCKCIEFLGLLLCNLPDLVGVTLTQKRLTKMTAEIDEWLAREPAEGELVVEPKELASVLGKLVFASQVVEGGRVYMQGMLSSFKGLVVDWRRGQVAPAGGRWGEMRVHAPFWRDLRWWRMHLRRRSLAPFGKPPAGEAVLSGTDASGWGTGQILWLDGTREEHVLRFTEAEKRRPINWRELLGVWRICELAGERLRGRTLLIETDNMAAKDCTRRMASKAADMQELVRRIYMLAERHGFVVRVTHTPGEKLDRPDQTSRGDAAEEPRARLRRATWERVGARWGPFDGLLGAERGHGSAQRRGEAVAADTRLWAHPTVSTVGTALRRIGERLAGQQGQGIRAVAVIPDDDEPQWSALVKHGLTVGRLGVGEEVMEWNVLGRWLPRPVIRPTRVVVFPRAAGAVAKRLRISVRESLEVVTRSEGSDYERVSTAGEGYLERVDGGGMQLPVLQGSFVYALAPDPSARGTLYQVAAANERELADSPDVLVGLEMLLDGSQAARQFRVPAYVMRLTSERGRPDPSQLWTVDHWVETAPPKEGAQRLRATFDWRGANVEIRGRGGARPRAETGGWVTMSPRESVVEGEGSARGSGDVPLDLEAVVGEAAPLHEDTGAAAAQDLVEVAAGLARLHASQSQRKTGAEGRIEAPVLAARGGGREGIVWSVTQPCQYAGMRCAGCLVAFEMGESMLSHGTAVTHDTTACRVAHDAAMETALQQGLAQECEDQFVGVFTDGREVSGVYDDMVEVEAMVERAAEHDESLVHRSFSSRQEASAFVTERTREAAAGGGRAGAREVEVGRGQMTHLAEKLSAPRMERVRRCIARQCGFARDDGTVTACRGGCGESLHAGTCAQLGKGYVALGNFTCADCRLALDAFVEEEVGTTVGGQRAPGARQTTRVSAEQRLVQERIMVMELSQGAEAAAASYSEYTRLEEEYVVGMGVLLDGGDLSLPRHSAEAFKNFSTWLVLDAERAQSLIPMVRAAEAFFTKLRILNFIKLDGSVMAHVRELAQECGIEAETATTATPRMLSLMVEVVIPDSFECALVVARERVQAVVEGVGGCRIGELAGGGECHGLLANETCVMTDHHAPEGQLCQQVVELKLGHANTGFSRYLDIAGTTETHGVTSTKYMMDYWKLAGFKVRAVVQAGVQVLRPDFWVLRVSLLGLSAAKIESLIAWVGKCEIAAIRAEAVSGGTAKYIRRRQFAKIEGERYVNIMGGASDDAGLTQGQRQLAARGFTATVVPGPLLLETTGGRQPRRTVMPLPGSSTFAPTKGLLDAAYVLANADPLDPDPDLDLRSGDSPRFSTHSLRRLANTVARRYREAMDVTSEEVDIFFGWHERIMCRAMQTHHEAMSVRKRMAGARITGML